ncbi:MAG: hypothetical protein P1V20_09800 [Verrucomicrobiales bacterium]|nr:hypothetical protein [Verrucomicrobiales bacterium]
MKSALIAKNHIRITNGDLDMVFPEPDKPLLEGPGESCTWEECMRETAVQTNYWLKHFGPDLSPPPFEDRFSLD